MHPSDYGKKNNVQWVFILSLFAVITLVMVVTYFVQKGENLPVYY